MISGFNLWTHRCRTNVLFVAVVILGVYSVVFDRHKDSIIGGEDAFDLTELEQELDSSNPVLIVSYKSPLDENIFRPQPFLDADSDEGPGRIAPGPRPRHSGRKAPPGLAVDSAQLRVEGTDVDTAARYHRVWTMADRLIDRKQMWPDKPEVDAIVEAMARAPIVGVDILDIGDYESGTAEKWVVTLLGGQKAVMKIVWEEKGGMKPDGFCNYGFEMPTSEIAGFHLHRALGFRNTPYVTGRRIDIRKEILPHASLAVTKQLVIKHNETCLLGKCYDCKTDQVQCRADGVFEVSLAYWIPRKLRVYTYPIKYMPYSTPRMDEWGKYGFNNRSYCEHLRRTIEPYEQESFYYDLFDFAVLDMLMNHYDSKHYSINDNSDANGLVIRLDHGRAFCAHDRDDEKIMLAPINQCCTLRKSTYENLLAVQNGVLSKRLKAALDRDPIAPILEDVWYPTLERRLKLVLALVDKCIAANGRDNVLVVHG